MNTINEGYFLKFTSTDPSKLIVKSRSVTAAYTFGALISCLAAIWLWFSPPVSPTAAVLISLLCLFIIIKIMQSKSLIMTLDKASGTATISIKKIFGTKTKILPFVGFKNVLLEKKYFSYDNNHYFFSFILLSGENLRFWKITRIPLNFTKVSRSPGGKFIKESGDALDFIKRDAQQVADFIGIQLKTNEIEPPSVTDIFKKRPEQNQ